jgi:hypothetical protein
MCSQLKYAQNAETLQRAYKSYEACLELNAPLLDNALKLRQGLAIGMEYESCVKAQRGLGARWCLRGGGRVAERNLYILQPTRLPTMLRLTN